MPVVKLSHGVVAFCHISIIISTYKQYTGIFKMTLTRDFSYDQLATIKSYFTQGEWDTIDAALEDYKCYADDEAAEEDLIDGIPVMDRIDSIDGKIYNLYKRLG